jgi:hypothetical protein
MAKYNFQVKGRAVTVDSWDLGQPLLYVLRNALGFVERIGFGSSTDARYQYIFF